MEKAREIKVKADEEFAIEKAKIVRQETQNLDQQAERKRKQAEIQKRMCVDAVYLCSRTQRQVNGYEQVTTTRTGSS